VQSPLIEQDGSDPATTDHTQVVLAEPPVIVAWSVPVAGQEVNGLAGQSLMTQVGPDMTVAQQLLVLTQPLQSVTVAQ
jgi:hypothetical protein